MISRCSRATWPAQARLRPSSPATLPAHVGARLWVTGLVASGPTASSVSLAWTAPATGGAVSAMSRVVSWCAPHQLACHGLPHIPPGPENPLEFDCRNVLILTFFYPTNSQELH